MAEDNQAPESLGDNPGDGSVADAIAAELAALEAEAPDNAPDEGNAEAEPAEADEESGDADETASTGEEDEAKPASSVEIEYEGKKYAVAPELKDAFLRQADYTRKTMEVAERSQQLQQREQTIDGAFKAAGVFAEGLAAMKSIDSNIAQTVKYLQDNPTLSSADPMQYATVTGNLSLLQVQRGQVQNALHQAAEQHSQFEEGRRRQNIVAGAKFLSENGIDSKGLQAIATYAKSAGLSPALYQQLNDGADPAALLVLDKARKYDELQAQKPKVQNKIAKAPPTVRPGAITPKTTSVEIYGKKLRSSGSINDAVALELARMERSARR